MDAGEVVRHPNLVHDSKYQDCIISYSWVVPYSPQLLRMFHCCFSAELCISKARYIKYLLNMLDKGKTESRLRFERHAIVNLQK